ncbi:P-selectin-like [Sycon ciliatum]|uniref:P-selectin-like n=1 Tax=Sycon ciliatum TaxID=27933 RepID=UPI0031F5FA6A
MAHWKELAECAPLTIGNAAVSSGPYRVNSIVNITCNAGFELSGSAVVICLDSLKWSSLPICNRVPLLPECPVLVVSNATVLSGSNKVNSIRSVSCNAGFELSGNSMVICMASKSWSTLPVCNRVPECPLLIVNNAVVSGGSTRVNSIRNVSCNSDFELSGSSLVTCLPSEEWTTLPVCNRVPQCPPLSISNGIVSGGSNTVNSISSITCNANFDLLGNSMVICLPTAAWSSPPVCNRVVECPTLTVNNAVLAGSSNTVTSVRNITCNDGFELSGNTMVTCLPGAEWSSTPSCNRLVQCGSLQVSNGKVSEGGNTVSSVRTVTCNLGYELGSDQTAVCLANGTWSSNPVCTDGTNSCPRLLAPANGRIDTGTEDIGIPRMYSCSDGYIIMGSPTTVCLQGGNWSHPAPACVRPCSEQQTTTSTIVAGAIGFLVGLIIPGTFMIVYQARRRGPSKITTASSNEPPTVFTSKLTENDAYEMTSTAVETNQEPQYETMCQS